MQHKSQRPETICLALFSASSCTQLTQSPLLALHTVNVGLCRAAQLGSLAAQNAPVPHVQAPQRCWVFAHRSLSEQPQTPQATLLKVTATCFIIVITIEDP